MAIIRYFVTRLRRHATVVFICGILSCFVIMIVLTLCNTPCVEPPSSRHKAWADITDTSTRKHPAEQKSYTIQTNLIIVVMSTPSHIDTRNTIRKTWAHSVPDTAAVRFVIGTKHLATDVVHSLQNENTQYKDLLFLEDLEESYSSLTKKLLNTFKWLNEHVKFNFLLKVDEDSFVRVDKILDELLTKPSERFYWGFFDGRAHVKKSGKWAEKDYVLCDRYLPYALGGGYVMSKDLVDYVASNWRLLKLLNSEDVSLGMWLAPLDIERQHEPNFDTEYKSRGCYNSYLITHKKSPADMQSLYKNIQTQGKLCVKETRVRLSYQYNWDNLPTKCCERVDASIP